MDLINQYKLGFEWFDEDLYLDDKKAAIKHKLQFVTVPANSSLNAPFSENLNDSGKTQFELACVKKLANKPPKKESNEVLLSRVPEPYRKLIDSYDILTPNYKSKPKHKIVHRIETHGPPCIILLQSSSLWNFISTK